MVNRIFTPRRLVRASQREEQNCLPRSEVICSGTPKRATQPPINAVAQLSAEVERRGIASAHRVERSNTVRRCVCPPAEAGSGPTRSTWRWLKRWVGLAMGSGGDAGEEDDLARWQGWQSRHQAAT